MAGRGLSDGGYGRGIQQQEDGNAPRPLGNRHARVQFDAQLEVFVSHLARLVLGFVGLIGLALRMAADFARWLYQKLMVPQGQPPTAK